MLRSMELAPEEMRVLACLAEKQLTTPAQYPLTLNALTLACNQTTSRDPVVSYDERMVEAVVTKAKTMGLARFVHPSHGRSALRYGHALDEVLGLDTRQLALMTVLMLPAWSPDPGRTSRTRTQRMAEFADLAEVESDLDGLARFEPPLVRRLDRQPGQKEERYIQLLGPGATRDRRPVVASVDDSVRLPVGVNRPGPPWPTTTPIGCPPAAGSADDALVAEVAELRAEVVALRRDVDELRTELGV